MASLRTVTGKPIGKMPCGQRLMRWIALSTREVSYSTDGCYRITAEEGPPRKLSGPSAFWTHVVRCVRLFASHGAEGTS